MTEKPSQTVQKLPPPCSFHLEAAQGWLLLGLPVDSLDELSRIAAGFQHQLNVQEVRYDALASCHRWDEALDVAGQILANCPRSPSGWIKQSYALHELHRTSEAREKLTQAERDFPKEWLIPYNLACYSCRLGDESTCLQWLAKAAERGEPKRILAIAMDDDDLLPVQSRLPGIFKSKA